MSEPAKKAPASFTMEAAQFGVHFEETYVFHGHKELEDFAKTAPFGDMFTLKVSGVYKKDGCTNKPIDKQAWQKRTKELTGVGE